MWILFVISEVMCDSDDNTCELKYTYYEQYESQMSCDIEMAILETTFMSDERAICVEEIND